MSTIDDGLREELSALIDGVLDEERAAALRRRLEEDAALRLEYDELRRTVEVVRALPRERAPTELRMRLNTRLRPRRRGRLLQLRWAVAAAAVLLVAVLGGLLATPRQEPGTSDRYQQARAEKDELSDDRRAQAPAPEPMAELREKIDGDSELDAAGEKSRDSLDKERPVESEDEAEADDLADEPAGAVAEADDTARALRESAESLEIPPGGDRAAGARAGRAKEITPLPAPAGAPDLATRLEAGSSLRPAERAAYLAQVRGFDARELHAHLRKMSVAIEAGALAEPRDESRGAMKKEGGVRPGVDVALASLDEARAVRDILLRADPRARALPGKGGQALAARRAPQDREGVVELELTLPAVRAEEVLAWLRRLDTRGPERLDRGSPRVGTPAAEEAKGVSGGRKTHVADRAVPVRRLRIRLQAPPARDLAAKEAPRSAEER